MARLGVLGGTFDPVHLGHLAVGQAAGAALGLDEVRLIPSRLPPHRDAPRASGFHRFAMAALTAVEQPGWTVADDELARAGASYSYDTLTALGADGRPATQIFFLIGADAFAEIATWSRYPAVLDLAHFVVVARPGTSLDEVRSRVPDIAGRLTDVAGVAHATRPAVVLLPTATPDVSSTAIRARAARGASLAGLVTGPVEQYIRRHGLYAGAPQTVRN